MLGKRVDQIGFSPTLAVSDLARRLKAAGEDVLDFSAGEPDFPTPDRVKEAGRRAIAADETRYTATPGIPELRQAIVRHLERQRGLRYEADQVVVSPGAKASLYFAFLALLDEGDEVIVPRPYWTSYPEQIRLAGGVPVFVDTPVGDGFRLGAGQLEAALTPRTRVVLLNYPSNPTGCGYSLDELRPLAGLCVERDLWIVADEIYSEILYDGRRFASVAQLGDDVRRRSLLIDGASKSFSMTGWRIGWTVGPVDAIRGMTKLQSHVTSNATSISQWAACEALGACVEEIGPRVAEFERRRDAMVAALDDLAGVTCTTPEGAFYLFPDVSGCFRGQVTSGQELATYLLEKAKVAVVPGEAFGAPNHVRFSYAVGLDRVREGMARVARALAEL